MSVVRKVAVGVVASGLAVAGLVGAASGASASTIIGQEFVDSNYNGAILSVTVGSNGFTCTGTTSDVDASLGSMPSGWNDRISSFRGFSNCWTKIYEHSGFGGAALGYQGDTRYVGDALNDQTSSIRWS
jgi:hypothetical protein